MKTHIYVYLLVCFLFSFVDGFASGNPTTSQKTNNQVSILHRGERPPIDYTSLTEEAYIPNLIRIKFSDKPDKAAQVIQLSANKSGIVVTGMDAFDQLSEQFGLVGGRLVASGLATTTKSGNHTFNDRHLTWGFHRWYEFETLSKSDVSQIVDKFSALECVEIAQPVFRVVHVADTNFTEVKEHVYQTDKAGGPTNDPRFSSQWNFHNTGQTGGTAGVDIRLAEAWEIERGHQDVIVAIIDGGVNTDHPDLAAHIWRDGLGQAGYNFVEQSFNIAPNNHATHIAGIIAAVSNNETGVAGIAGGSGAGDGVRIMSLQVFDAKGCDGFHLAPIFAADHGAVITQNSWVYAVPDVYDHLALDAIDYFNTYGGGDMLQGGITVFSAGNNNSGQLYYPASYSGTIAVASTSHNDQKAASSNYGEWIDISAPGVNIISTLANGSYGSSSGTSMACPHVAGTLALMVSHAPGLLTNTELVELMLSAADCLDANNTGHNGLLGSGRLNAFRALKSLPNVNHETEQVDPDNENEEEDAEENAHDPASDTTNMQAYHALLSGQWQDPGIWFTDSTGTSPASSIPCPNSIIHIHKQVVSNLPVELGPFGVIKVHAKADLTIEDLHVNTPAQDTFQLIVEPAGRLTINGHILNQNQRGDLNMLIRGNENNFGSVIHADASIRASISHERIMASHWELLSVPLQNQTICHEVVQGMLYGWSEPMQGWAVINQASTNAEGGQENNPARFTPGMGYLQQFSKSEPGSLTHGYKGDLTSGPVHLHLSKKASASEDFSGFNLLGNPYASSLDWKASSGWSGRENLDGGMDQAVSVWVWNPGTGNYGAYNSASSGDLGTNQASRYIAPMQAFWVKAATDGADITVNNEARVHSDQQTLKNLKHHTPSVISLKVSNQTNAYSDEVILEFGHHAHSGTKKMFSMFEEAPSLYVMNQSEPTSIYFMDRPQASAMLPLGFEAGISALYTITASDLSSVDGNIYLIDNLTGHKHDLKRNSSYHFMGNPWDEAGRFMLQFGEDISTNVNEATTENTEVFYHSQTLNITNPWGWDATIQVYNISGASVAAFEVPAFSTHQHPFSERPGVYLVKASGQGSEVTTRVAVF